MGKDPKVKEIRTYKKIAKTQNDNMVESRENLAVTLGALRKEARLNGLTQDVLNNIINN